MKLDGQVCVSARPRAAEDCARGQLEAKRDWDRACGYIETENMRFMIQQQRVRPPLVARKTIRLNDDALGSASCFARSE